MACTPARSWPAHLLDHGLHTCSIMACTPARSWPAHLLDPANIKDLGALLEYHVLGVPFTFGSAGDGDFYGILALEGGSYRVGKSRSGVCEILARAGGPAVAKATSTGGAVSNGVVYAIDQRAFSSRRSNWFSFSYSGS
jgi:hypothetical protein